jgi:hypothetical protein
MANPEDGKKKAHHHLLLLLAECVIRWVRLRIYQQVPWSAFMARLRELWTLTASWFSALIRSLLPREARMLPANP